MYIITVFTGHYYTFLIHRFCLEDIYILSSYSIYSDRSCTAGIVYIQTNYKYNVASGRLVRDKVGHMHVLRAKLRKL